MPFTKPRGTQDFLPGEVEKYQRVEEILRSLCKLYDVREIRTPTFEDTNLFHRGVGETTDVVTKETYDFKDKADRNITLKPEGTAGVVRSYIENKLYAARTLEKYYYITPVFRYENPQKGRYREFHQFGVEAIGSSDPMCDAEILSFAYTIIKAFRLQDVKVKINSIGDEESRKNYRDALIAYFTPYMEDLCEDCKARIQKNPLRILDCKKDSSKEYFKNAPKIGDYLNDYSKEYFNKVLNYLEILEIPYEICPNLVRGLDYYTHTVFEIEASIEGFGSGNVLAGGGRYDKLVETLDGPSIPAIGFAVGLERLVFALDAQKIHYVPDPFLHFYYVGLGDKAREHGMKLLYDMRLEGYMGDMCYTQSSFKNQLKQADDHHAKFILIVGDDELANHTINVKNTQTKEQVTIQESELESYLEKSFRHTCHGCHEKEE